MWVNPQPAAVDLTDLPYSHLTYLLVHPKEQFFKVGVAHRASAEIRNYVMAGCQIAQLVFLSRNDAHQLATIVLDSIPEQTKTISAQHPILGEEALCGYSDSWTADGGYCDLVQMAESMHMPHLNAFAELPYEVVRTMLGVPRLPWVNWRIGDVARDYTEPQYPARTGVERGSVAHL
jgi:hypothetical protein